MMKIGSAGSDPGNANPVNPFLYLGREERRRPLSGLKGIAMRRFGLAATLAAVLVLLSASAALAPPTNKDELLKDEQHRLQQSQTLYQGGQKAGSASNMEVVGHNDLGGRGFNADVWAHEGFAYIGHWGFTDWAQGSKTRFCPAPPNNGVAVVDYRDPANPQMVSRLVNPTGTSAEDVVVFTARFGPLAGRDIAAAGLQVCGGSRTDESFPRGLMLWDVTNPAAPVEVWDWGIIHDAGGPLGPGQGCDPDPVYGHSAEPSADGKTVFLAYWDSGFVALDVTNPANPVLLGGIDYAPDEDGDAHSSSYDDARRLLFTADEDFCKNSGPEIERGLGYLRVYDFSDPADPVQIGEYRTPNSLGKAAPGSGDYSIHNPLVVGTTVYASWYSDGVRVLDVSNPTNPSEIA